MTYAERGEDQLKDYSPDDHDRDACECGIDGRPCAACVAQLPPPGHPLTQLKGHRPPPPPPTNEQQAMYHLDVARRAADGDNDTILENQGRAIANALVGIGYLLAAIKDDGVKVYTGADALDVKAMVARVEFGDL